jgi:hypothetical protein
MRAFERQEKESSKAFAAFTVYRDLGPQRSFRETAEMLGKSETLVRRWAVRFTWHERIRGYEDWLEMLKRDAIETYEREHTAEMQAKRDELRGLMIENALKAAEQERLMLDWPLKETVDEEIDELGRVVHKTIAPAKWSKADAKKMHDIVREAIGDPKQVDMSLRELREQGVDFSMLSDKALERIVAGEDVLKVWHDHLSGRDD